MKKTHGYIHDIAKIGNYFIRNYEKLFAITNPTF